VLLSVDHSSLKHAAEEDLAAFRVAPEPLLHSVFLLLTESWMPLRFHRPD
jgi:hypothetical protein